MAEKDTGMAAILKGNETAILREWVKQQMVHGGARGQGEAETETQSREFLGTCGSIAWLTPRLGTDTSALFVDPKWLLNTQEDAGEKVLGDVSKGDAQRQTDQASAAHDGHGQLSQAGDAQHHIDAEAEGVGRQQETRMRHGPHERGNGLQPRRRPLGVQPRVGAHQPPVKHQRG